MSEKKDPLGGIYPPDELPERKTINVHGRREHESYLKDPKKCADAGLDIAYETMIYLKRWGGWLEDED